jgi:hypothetical protein
MTSTITIIAAVIAIGLGYLFIRKRGGTTGRFNLRGLFSGIFPVDPKREIVKYKIATVNEMKKSADLRALLEAKRALAYARSVNIRLHKDIATAARKPDLRSTLPPPKSKV